MTPRQQVQRYFDVFFVSHDFDSLTEIFHDDLQFRGPLVSFDSAADYIAGLKHDPPVDCRYEKRFECDGEEGINVIYRFLKPGLSVEMSQLFQFRNNKISRILLIFDSSRF